MATGRPAGRPAKPTSVKIAEGNPGKRKLPDATPAQGRKVETKRTAYGTYGNKLYKQIMEAADYLDQQIDTVLVGLLCEAYQEYQTMLIALNKGTVSRFYTAPNGYIVSHPYVKEVQELRKQMTAWLAAIGFSPADRARLNIAEAVAEDEMDRFLRRRQEREEQNGE